MTPKRRKKNDAGALRIRRWSDGATPQERQTPEYQTWRAMLKFAEDKPLTEAEWAALSDLTMIDRSRLYFGPGNVRWAKDDAERADNLAFYRSLGK